jgi:hypothetical protein
METNKPEATQLPLTPEAANPPSEKPKVKPDAGNWNVVPEVILPAKEDHHVETTEERREKYSNGNY